LFNDYYSELVDILPATDLSHYFVSDKIILLSDYYKILEFTMPQQAAKLLLDRVSLQLKNGNDVVFNKMLLIMDHYGDTTVKELSQEIKTKLSTVKCKDSIASDNGQGNYISYVCSILVMCELNFYRHTYVCQTH